MTGLVPALARQLHAQLPRCVGELGQALRGDVEAGDLVAHVPVHDLAPRYRSIALLVHLRVSSDDAEAGVARRILAKPEIVDLHPIDSCHDVIS